jgi:hypothetical protein
LYVVGNRFTGNRVGATTDSDHQEALGPQHGAVLAGNLVAANQQAATPEQADGGFGIGLGLAGGTGNLVTRNLVEANRTAGLELANADDFPVLDNQVRDNTFRGNGVDVAYGPATAALGRGNCLAGNALTTVVPPTLARRCPATGAGPTPAALPATHPPPGIAFTDVTAPPPQPNRPDTAHPTRIDTSRLPGRVDVAAVPMPTPALLQAESAIRW